MNTRGYTLLEVTLFMAISSLLALTAFVGLGPRLRNVRFTDSVRSLEASVNQQFSGVSQGANARTGGVACQPSGNAIAIGSIQSNASVGGDQAGCVLNGVVAEFSQNQVAYRKIVSLRVPATGCSVAESDPLYSRITQCHAATIIASSVEQPVVYSYSNGLQKNGDSSDFSVGFLQDPAGTEKVLFSFQGTGQSKLPDAQIRQDVLKPCFELGPRQAQLVFTPPKIQPELNINECVSA